MINMINNHYIYIICYLLSINYVKSQEICARNGFDSVNNQIQAFKTVKMPSFGCLSIDQTMKNHEVHILKVIGNNKNQGIIDVYFYGKEINESVQRFSIVLLSNEEISWHLHYNRHLTKIYVANITTIWLNERKVATKYKTFTKAIVKEMPILNEMSNISDLRKRFNVITSYIEIDQSINLINFLYLNENRLPFCIPQSQLQDSVAFKREAENVVSCINKAVQQTNNRQAYYIKAPVTSSNTIVIVIQHNAIHTRQSIFLILSAPDNIDWILMSGDDLRMIDIHITTNSRVDTKQLLCASLRVAVEPSYILKENQIQLPNNIYNDHILSFTFLTNSSNWINLNLDQLITKELDKQLTNESLKNLKEAQPCGNKYEMREPGFSLLLAFFVSLAAFSIGVIFMMTLWLIHYRIFSQNRLKKRSSKDCSAETTPGSTSPITVYQVACH